MLLRTIWGGKESLKARLRVLDSFYDHTSLIYTDKRGTKIIACMDLLKWPIFVPPCYPTSTIMRDGLETVGSSQMGNQGMRFIIC